PRTEIDTLSLHDALPILDGLVEFLPIPFPFGQPAERLLDPARPVEALRLPERDALDRLRHPGPDLGIRLAGQRLAQYRDAVRGRSEEHPSELQSPCNLVC